MLKGGIKTPLTGTWLIIWLQLLAVSSVLDPWSPCYFSNAKRSVNCSGRNMSTIPKCVLANEKIERLNLSMNSIAYLPSRVFANLSNLRTLNLSRNLLTRIENDTFKNLSKLVELDLSFNKLDRKDSFGVGMFDPLKLLHSLYIQGNLNPRVSSDYTYPDAALSKATSVQNLFIDGLPSKVFGQGFSGMKHIRLLHFNEDYGYCDLTNILPGTFHSFRETTLERIELISCEMTVVPPHTFAGLKSLTSIKSTWGYRLCDQSVDNITAGLDKTNIKRLEFDNMCHISSSTLRQDTFNGLTNTSLERLSLAGNTIDYIDPEAIHNLPKTLKYLSIRDNYITNVPFLLEEVVYLKNLEVLDVSYQQVYYPIKGHISSSNFPLWSIKKSNNTLVTLPPKLRYLYMWSVRLPGPVMSLMFAPNVLKYLDMSSCQLTAFMGPWTGLHHLTFLNMSSNNFAFIHLETFSDMYNLKTLLLQNNEIGKQIMLDKTGELFSNLTSLEHLDLGNNGIKNLPSNIFRSQRNLLILVLTGNSLTDIQFDIDTMVGLQMLNLSNNQLNSMPYGICKDLDQLAIITNITVDLMGNVLACNCEHRDFINWLEITQVLFVDRAYQMCIDEGVKEVFFSSDVFKYCFSIIFLSLTCIICIWVVYLGLTSTWIWLRYLFLIFWRNFNHHPIVEDEIEITNDVYISFEHDYPLNADVNLNEFVKKRIYPYLLSKDMSIIIRDDIEAERRMDVVITTTIRCTRKVITLLTSSYCHWDDVWRHWEFNTAVTEGINTNRSLLVPVVIGETTLKDNMMTHEVMSYLNSMEADVLLFSGKEEDVERFLEALYGKLID